MPKAVTERGTLFRRYWCLGLLVVSHALFLPKYFVGDSTTTRDNGEQGVSTVTKKNQTTGSTSSSSDWNNTALWWWEDMSQRLCPNMNPQSGRYAAKIFDLARRERWGGNNGNNNNNNNTTGTAISTPRPSSCDKAGDNRMSHLFFKDFVWGGASRLSDAINTTIMANNIDAADGSQQTELLQQQQGNVVIEEMFSYIHIWKCANDQLSDFWRVLFPESNKSAPFGARWDLLSSETVAADHSLHRDCIVTAIRDPVSHFLSGYNEVEDRIQRIIARRKLVKRYWPFGQYPIGSTARFEQFVTDIISCPVVHKRSGITDDYPNRLELHHVYSMTLALYILKHPKQPKLKFHRKIGKPVDLMTDFHYLPSLNNLAETWGPFIVQSCPNSFSEATKQKILTTPMNVSQGNHPSAKDPWGTYSASKAVWKKGGPVARALCALHIMDYACWKDLPDGIPPLCREVYKEYHEEGLI